MSVVIEKAKWTTSHLLIQKATSKDSGIYKCAPLNAVTATINLHVLRGEKSGHQTLFFKTLALTRTFAESFRDSQKSGAYKSRHLKETFATKVYYILLQFLFNVPQILIFYELDLYWDFFDPICSKFQTCRQMPSGIRDKECLAFLLSQLEPASEIWPTKRQMQKDLLNCAYSICKKSFLQK